ncbi:MAG TPA: hypothetical protein VJY33_02290, partial [Isosphaeraceae bacterium]|nr:hypothetical protein [Isosphaeraceae bacterium]
MDINASLDRLSSFGDVAAEDDTVLDYFLKTDAVSRIQTSEVFLVLGRKGSGKTALVRYFVEGQWQSNSKSLNLRGYPWNIHAQRVDKGASEIEAYVSSWRYLIAVQFAALSLARNPATRCRQGKSIRSFLEQNYGGIAPQLGEVLKPSKLRLSNLSFEPEVLGCKLGGIALERTGGDRGFGLELNALSDLLITAAAKLAAENELPSLFLHVDELDQGLSSMTEERSRMLIGLILAARSVRHFCRNTRVPISPIVYLRTDLWDELKFSDKNKNKISETLTLHLEWDSRSLLDLTNTRLRARLSPEVGWDSVATPSLMRGSQTKWNHILSRTFLRPRDVIKFLNVALGEAKKRHYRPLLLDNKDIINAREQYSAYLKSELDD